MHTVDQIRTLYAYHFDTTLRLIALAEGLPELDEEGGSVRDLLFHILDTDRGWRGGLETGQRPQHLRSEDYSGLVALRRGFEEEGSAWEAFLAGLDDTLIGQDVELRSSRGQAFRFGLWKVLYHVALHGMQHHAEIAERLTRAGRSPGDIDFIFYA